MHVLWNGRKGHPGGRQLFIPEYPHPETPRSVMEPRQLHKIGQLSPTTRAERESRVRSRLRQNPQTAAELSALLHWPAERTAAVLATLLRRGEICRWGERNDQPVYDLVEI